MTSHAFRESGLNLKFLLAILLPLQAFTPGAPILIKSFTRKVSWEKEL